MRINLNRFFYSVRRVLELATRSFQQAFVVISLPGMLAAASPILNTLNEKKEKEAPEPISAIAKTKAANSPVSLLKEPCDSSWIKTDLTFLVWQASEDGLEFAARNRPRCSDPTHITTDISSSLATIDFTWNPAFKFLFGYHCQNPSWDVAARWTWFYSHSNQSVSESLSDTGRGLFPLWIPPQAALTSYPVYNHSKATLLLHLNTVDLEIAYLGGVSPSFFLKLSGGLKGIIIDQTFRVKYSGGLLEGATQMLDSNTWTKNKCTGLGPRVGLGAKWVLAHGISLIAETAGACALSTLKTKREDRSLGLSSGTPQTVSVNFYENFWVWRPLIEGKTGVKWETCLGNNKQRILQLELAYEMQHYWEQNMLIRYADDAILYAAFNHRGNLTLQGFSLTLSVGY